jgi:hypothetical protein
MKSVWEIPPPEPEEKRFGKHPTQKPLRLLERILLAASNEGDLVLDPFMGSGTTALAALRLRRAVVAADYEAVSVTLALARIMGELVSVHVFAACFFSVLDLEPCSMDRSGKPTLPGHMTLLSKAVYRECKYFFVGLDRREVIFSVVAPSLDAAWKAFQSRGGSPAQVFSVIKTETEIYLTQ